MPSEKLGLPFEYQQYPEYFDAVNINETTESTNALIARLLKKNRVNSLLDMTCGTGSQIFYLKKLGYEVVGSDFSPDLLKIAKRRASAEKVNIKFIHGDMRTVKAGTFDAVITIFNAIGHLAKKDFEKTLNNISCHLKPGGIYIFDILNLAAMTDKKIPELSYHVHQKFKHSQFYKSQCSIMDRKNGRLISYDQVMIQKGAQKPKLLHCECALQLYRAKELRDLLSKHGFETLAQYDMDGKKLIPNKSLSILTVARKK